MSKRVALVVGVTGQDGSYLTEHLLGLNYEVVGVKRRSSTDNTWRLNGVLDDPSFRLVEGDVTDYASMSGIISQYNPIEVYNLAAQSHVGTSFHQPIATFQSTAVGVVNLLEVIKQGSRGVRFYQASTSELMGVNHDNGWQNEQTPFAPQSPYAIAKLAAHQMVGIYRQSYDMFACCGILFNHEGPRRGEHFVTRKITKYVGWLHHQLQHTINPSPTKLGLGNLDASRDFGHARDYVKAMHLMLQVDKPKDYVVATGTTHTVREFCEVAFAYIGCDYKDWVYIDPQFLRPSEVPYLRGDATLARQELKWEHTTSFRDLVHEMVEADIQRART